MRRTNTPMRQDGRATRRMVGRQLLTAIAALATVFAAVPAQAQKPSTAPALSVIITSGTADTNGHVHYIDVAMTVPDATAIAGAPVFWMPYIVANVESAARTLAIGQVSDVKGELVLSPQDAEKGTQRVWIAARDVSGSLTIRYRVPVDNTPSAIGTGPPFQLRTEGNGFSGAGLTFLLAPAGERPYRISVHFDLSALGAGATAMTIFGDGDVHLDAEPFGRLTQGFYMAGQLRRYPPGVGAGGFSSAWLDPIPFDGAALMAWTEGLYRWYSSFFRADAARPYRVFMRYNPINPGGGVALPNAFVVTHDAKSTSPDDLKVTLAHEMLHTQIAGIAQWFSEGAATYYARELAMRAGALTPAQFLGNLNALAARYYTNLLIATPNAELQPRFWEDTRIRTLPYDRGSFYLAVVDGRIRKASGGTRSLDDLVLGLVARNRAHQPVNQDLWVELLTKEYGATAKAEFDAMLAGATQLPESNGFGRCFQRVTKPFRRFELGFDSKILAERGRVVRGIVAGSAAEQAGLRDGDEIVVPVALDAVQGEQDRSITYQVRREGRVLNISYLPRGETVQTYQWERVPGVPDAQCSR